jgi:hypothetical protein
MGYAISVAILLDRSILTLQRCFVTPEAARSGDHRLPGKERQIIQGMGI